MDSREQFTTPAAAATTEPVATIPTTGGGAPAWSPTAAYPGGSVVVFDGRIYAAKWWSQGDMPTTDVAEPWDTPWELVPGSSSTTTVPTTTVPTAVPPTTTVPVGAVDTNPADAPYPEWSATIPYTAGYLVASDGYVYAAKWWSQGDMPTTDVAEPFDTPWELVGTVPAGSRGPDLPRLPAGTYPAWSASATYLAGDVVLLDGLAYEAKWWTSGSSPAGELDDPLGSPWTPLFVWPGEPAGGY